MDMLHQLLKNIKTLLHEPKSGNCGRPRKMAHGRPFTHETAVQTPCLSGHLLHCFWPQ
jgi:hypothetical protein